MCIRDRWKDEELSEHLPSAMKRFIAQNDIDFYTIDAVTLANEIGLGARINTIMQSAFFKLAKVIPLEDAIKYMKESIVKSYGRRGEEVVQMNYKRCV